jgi:hypothetical protein
VGGYPDQDLEVTCGFAFGADATTPPSTWAFTDLSARLIQAPITINWGVLVGQGSHRSASTTITLLNNDGALTPLLPTSQYFPYVDVGTPGYVKLRSNTTPWISDTFGRTVASGWGVADSGQTWGANAGASVSGGAGLITFSAAGQIKATTISGLAYHDAWVMWDASLSVVSTGASHVCGCVIRSDGSGNNYLWAGMEFGLGGVVQWTIRSVQAGVEVIEQQVTQPGLTYAANQKLRCEVQLIGDTLQARAWNAAGTAPDGWACSVQLTQLADLAASSAGMRTWCVPGNTNTQPTVLSIDNLSFSQPRYPRIEGYITDVRPSFQQLSDGTTFSTVQVDIGGIGTRTEKEDDSDLSPLRRSLQQSQVPPVVYWPCEDGQGATQVASAFETGTPMIVNGPAVFDFDVGLSDDAVLHSYGTSSLCSIAAGASLLGLISPAVGSSAWTVSASMQQYTPGVGGGVTEVRQLEWATPGGTFNRWALVSTMTGYQVRAYNDAAGTSTTVTTSVGVDKLLAAYDVTAAQVGGNITVAFYINTVQFATASVAGTLTGVNRVTANPDKVNTTASVNPYGIRFIVGQIAVHDQALAGGLPYYFDGSLLLRADQGWGYEYAHRRFGRLCDEERIRSKVIGNPYVTGTTQLNVQQPGSFTPLITAAAEAESGAVVTEDGYGYTMLPRGERYNAGVDLTVDMAVYKYSGSDAGDVLTPKLDARGPNFWTIQRTNGSQAVAAADAAYRKRRGTIRESATLDVLYDDDCAQHASWRVHLYTDGQQANYPNLTLDLAANPELVDAYLRLRVGSRVQRINQPTIAGLGVIDQVVDQMSETFTPRQAGGPSWTATLDCSPATVWQVGAFDDARYDSSSTTLAADVNGAATVLGFSTAIKADAWATDEPLMEVTIGGQDTVVQWMSGIGSIAQLEGGFETGITGWQGTNAALAQSSTFARAGSKSAQLTVTGSPASAVLTQTTPWPVLASTAYDASFWIYGTSPLPNVQISISWYTAGAVFVSSFVNTPATIPAGVWTQITLTGTSPGTAGLARVSALLVSNPPAGTVAYVDDVDLCLTSAPTGPGPYVQKAWVVRDPVVTGALKAGSEIHVADPLWWGL